MESNEVSSFILEFAKKMKIVEENILQFLETEKENELILDQLDIYLDQQQIRSNRYELKSVLHLIVQITNNYHHILNFYTKIEQLLSLLKNEMINFYSNYELFNIFKSNKRLLLYLFEDKIIIPDKTITKILTNSKFEDKLYPNYFYTELNSFYNEILKRRIKSNNQEISKIYDNNKFNEILFDEFEKKRKNGENDNFICNLIQNDSIDEFIFHMNHTNSSLSIKIEESIYETNSYLMSKNPSLIEYSAFCGSIQIFKYLLLNKVNLSPFLWLYAIHGKNAEIIHLLEEINVLLVNDSYLSCLKESIKCHYVDLIDYFKYIVNQNKLDENFDVLSICLHFYNFEYLEEFIDVESKSFNNIFANNFDFDDDRKSDFFYFCCKYDYYVIVDFLLKNMKINVNYVSDVFNNISFK